MDHDRHADLVAIKGRRLKTLIVSEIFLRMWDFKFIANAGLAT